MTVTVTVLVARSDPARTTETLALPVTVPAGIILIWITEMFSANEARGWRVQDPAWLSHSYQLYRLVRSPRPEMGRIVEMSGKNAPSLASTSSALFEESERTLN